jgi:DNA polymerase V
MYGLVDCNNFFASCERLFRPELEGKPVVILSNNDGCIISRSNEAKAFGVKMGVPYFEARDIIKKNNIHVFSSNYALYGDISQRVMRTLALFAPEIEIYSIDEAFLHLEGISEEQLPPFTKQLREKVVQWTGMPISIGVAPTKTLAKVANHVAKKYKGYKGVFCMDTEERTSKVLQATTVGDVWGIGRNLKVKLENKGIFTALQLRDINDFTIRKIMGVTGERMVKELRGIPCLGPQSVPTTKNGITTSRSFGKVVETYIEMEEAVATYTTRCAEKLRKQKSAARLISVYLSTNRFKDEEQYRNYQVVELPTPTNNSGELIQYAIKALKMIYRKDLRYKKAGIIVMGLIPEDTVQMDIFDVKDRVKAKKISEVMDRLNARMGFGSIAPAILPTKTSWMMRSEMRSPGYTTKWEDLPVVDAGK